MRGRARSTAGRGSGTPERLAAAVWSQWPGRKPLRLEDQFIEWLITDDPDEIDRFQPAHDCEQCRLGNVKAREHLRTHPGEKVALGNISYVPVWPGLV